MGICLCVCVISGEGWAVRRIQKVDLRQNWGVLHCVGVPPAWTHWRENSDMVLHRQNDSALLLQWHKSAMQALVNDATSRRPRQLPKAGAERSCSHTAVCRHTHTHTYTQRSEMSVFEVPYSAEFIDMSNLDFNIIFVLWHVGYQVAAALNGGNRGLSAAFSWSVHLPEVSIVFRGNLYTFGKLKGN